jgi:hypothetical protein
MVGTTFPYRNSNEILMRVIPESGSNPSKGSNWGRDKCQPDEFPIGHPAGRTTQPPSDTRKRLINPLS